MSHELRAWRRVDSRVVYQTRHVLVREDVLELPDGRAERYPVMALGGSAGILPLLPGGEVVLVRQFRHVPAAFSWEIPGGAIVPGEAPDAAAQRELREETGLRAGRLRPLGHLWPNNAYLDEVIHLFVAEELTPDPLPADADEHLERRAFASHEALAMARDDRIGCGLTKLALLWAAADGLFPGPGR
jgi:ADP-ribose pyrophosphatase